MGPETSIHPSHSMKEFAKFALKVGAAIVLIRVARNLADPYIPAGIKPWLP